MPKEGRTRSSGRKKGGRAPRTGKTTTTRQTSNTFLTANSPGGGGGDDHEVSLDPSSGGGGGSSGSRNTSITRNVGELKERLQGRHRKSMTQLFFLVFVTLIIGAVTIALAYLFKPRNKAGIRSSSDHVSFKATPPATATPRRPQPSDRRHGTLAKNHGNSLASLAKILP